MDAVEYKRSKELLGISKPNIWCMQFQISIDIDKSYSSGRKEIPEKLSKIIRKKVDEHIEKVLKLQSHLKEIFPDSKVEIDQEKNDILVNIPKENQLKIKNNGINNLGFNIYSFMTKGRNKRTLVYYPEDYWKNTHTCFDWFLWDSIEAKPSMKLGPPFQKLTQKALLDAYSNK